MRRDLKIFEENIKNKKCSALLKRQRRHKKEETAGTFRAEATAKRTKAGEGISTTERWKQRTQQTPV